MKVYVFLFGVSIGCFNSSNTWFYLFFKKFTKIEEERKYNFISAIGYTSISIGCFIASFLFKA